jgi:hypothetical protein
MVEFIVIFSLSFVDLNYFTSAFFFQRKCLLRKIKLFLFFRSEIFPCFLVLFTRLPVSTYKVLDYVFNWVNCKNLKAVKPHRVAVKDLKVNTMNSKNWKLLSLGSNGNGQLRHI